MKKNYSLLFTNKITGILKSSIKSDRVFVQTTEKGIYVSDGHFAIKFSENDYRELVQPAVMRDPGNFTIDKTGIREGACNLEKLFTDTEKENAVEAFDGIAIEKGGNSFFGLYGKEKDLPVFISTRFREMFGAVRFYVAGSTKPVAVYSIDYEPANQELVAIVLPINAGAALPRALRAFFTEDAPDVEEMRNKIAKLEAENRTLETRIECSERLGRERETEFKARLEAVKSAAAADTKADPASARNADEIVKKFEGLDGVTVTIKGAKTEKPVIWITGNTKEHADKIKAAGAKWSAKKSAWYVAA